MSFFWEYFRARHVFQCLFVALYISCNSCRGRCPGPALLNVACYSPTTHPPVAGGFVRRCPGPALRGGAGRLVFLLFLFSLLKNSARLAHFSVYHFSRNSKLVVADAVGVSLSRFPTLLGSTRLSCSCTNSPSPAVLLHTASDDRTDLEAITAYVP